jgi:predicted nucleic acid-binding protein
MIAGIAKANKLKIATRNLKDFKRILGLRFLNVSY